jgi:hypothetical protein
MKRIFAFILLGVLIACNGEKKKAQAMLVQAESFFAQSLTDSALITLDSLKTRYPKEFEVLKAAQTLRRQIEVENAQQTIAICDSLLPIREAEIEKIKQSFIYEKDPEYDDVGKYFDKSQKIENKLQRSYIRCWTTEQGEFFLASVYYGKAPIGHTGLKLSLRDGSSVATADIPPDGGLNYSFRDLGMATEVVTYSSAKDGSAAHFIYDNSAKTINAEYTGGKRFLLTVQPADVKALVHTMDFAALLAETEKMKTEREKASTKLEYLNRKLGAEQMK